MMVERHRKTCPCELDITGPAKVVDQLYDAHDCDWHPGSAPRVPVGPDRPSETRRFLQGFATLAIIVLAVCWIVYRVTS